MPSKRCGGPRVGRPARAGGVLLPSSPRPRGGVPAPRSRRRPPCDAGGGGGAAARAFAWAEGKAASPVCFIFSWQLRAAQLRSAGGAGGAAGEGGPTERASEPADGAPAERGYRRQAGGRAAASRAAERRRRPRPPPRRLRERQAAASGVPPLRPRLPSGWRLGARLLPRRLPRRSRGAPGPCRWPVPGWSWGGCSLLPTPPSPSWPSPRLRSGSR